MINKKNTIGRKSKHACITIALFLLSIHVFAQQWEQKGIAFVINFAEENMDSLRRDFSDELDAQLPTEQIQAIRDDVYAKMGDLETILEPDYVENDDFETYTFPLIFEHGNLGVKLSISHEGEIVGFYLVPYELPDQYIPPPYMMPDLVEEIDIPIPGEYRLEGQFVKPRGLGPYPLVILIPGSGPQDMDLSMGNNKPFKDLALGLAMHGIATYRFDKRTFTYPDAFQDDYTVYEEIVHDAQRAFELMSNQAEVDKSNIYFLGHSFGGMLMPRILGSTPKAKGAVLMAANARPVEDLILEQIEYIYNYEEENQSNDKHFKEIKQLVENVKKLEEGEEMNRNNLPFGIPASYWLDLKDYEPAKALRKQRVPVLILQGERDYQVTTKDYKVWRKSIRKRFREAHLYPKLNHLFFEGEGPSLPDEYHKQGNVPLYVIMDIADWIKDSK